MILFWSAVIFLVLLSLSCLVIPLRLQTASGVQKHPMSIALCLIGIPVMALVLYFHWGSSQQLPSYFLRKELGTPLEVIERMKAHLAQHPNSAQGWYLLGRLYVSQQQFHEAADAFKKAETLEAQQS